ncbi:hypothetical protein ACOME3_009885 [Neoechinorhynchus agilis]
MSKRRISNGNTLAQSKWIPQSEGERMSVIIGQRIKGMRLTFQSIQCSESKTTLKVGDCIRVDGKAAKSLINDRLLGIGDVAVCEIVSIWADGSKNEAAGNLQLTVLFYVFPHEVTKTKHLERFNSFIQQDILATEKYGVLNIGSVKPPLNSQFRRVHLTLHFTGLGLDFENNIKFRV